MIQAYNYDGYADVIAGQALTSQNHRPQGETNPIHGYDAGVREPLTRGAKRVRLKGLFLSVDPVTFMDTGNPGMFNRYAYVENDPINMIDPFGLCGTRAESYQDCTINVDRSGDAGITEDVQDKGIETLTKSILSIGKAVAENGTKEETDAWESITEFNINSNQDYKDKDGNTSYSTMATANGTTTGGGSVDIWAEGVHNAAYDGANLANHIVIHEMYHYTADDISNRKAVYQRIRKRPVTGAFALKTYERISDNKSVAAGRRLGLLSSGYEDKIYE